MESFEVWKSLSHAWLSCDPMDCSPPGSPVHGFSRQAYWNGLPISCSSGSSWARDQTRVSSITGRFFTIWATREAHWNVIQYLKRNELSHYRETWEKFKCWWLSDRSLSAKGYTLWSQPHDILEKAKLRRQQRGEWWPGIGGRGTSA